MTATPDDDAFLHDLIADHLSDNELREVVLEMGFDPDNLSGERKKDRAIELMRLAQRQNALPLLLERLGDEVPGVDWAAAEVPPLPLYERPRGKLIIGLGVIALLLALAALLTWLYYRPSAIWATNAPVDPDALGIAVAELGVSADCRRGAAGREASALLYQTLEEQIRSVGLQRRAPLTKVGLICNQEQAIAAGRRVAADLVIWGWVPQSTEGILGQYTFVDPPEGVGAESLAKGLELLVGGPGQARFYRITGRTESLVRFVLGLVYAKQKEYDDALEMFNRAIAIIESDTEAVDNDSLAVLYTERGKVQAAMGEADEAFVSYRKAESLNPDYIGMQIAFGAYYYSMREWDNARRYFRQAARQQEPLPAIAYGLGLLEYYAGDFQAAVGQLEEAVRLTLALDEEPVLPWLGLGYAYAELGNCPASDAAFTAIVDSVSAEDNIRAAAGVETGRCERARQVMSAVQPAGAATIEATMMPTAVAAAATAYAELAMALPASSAPVCALRATELRVGPGAEFAAAARLEAGGAAGWDGARAGNWLRVTLAPGFEAWASAFDFTPCAGGTPWAAATGAPPVVWPTIGPPLPTLLSTPAFAPPTPTPTLFPSPTLLGTPIVPPPPTATQSINARVSETPPPAIQPSPTETLLPTLPPTPTAIRPIASATLLPTETPTLLPTETPTLLPEATATMQPTATETLLPAPSETYIPSGTEEP